MDAPIVARNTWTRLRLLKNMPRSTFKTRGYALTRWENSIVDRDKTQGKFYPLQHEEWLRACRELTKAELEVLYFIRTLDPRNSGIRITAAEIARQLSTPDRKVHRQTISRALKQLDTKGFIDLDLVEVQVKVKPKGYWCDETPAVRTDTNSVYRHQGCDETPSAIATHQDG